MLFLGRRLDDAGKVTDRQATLDPDRLVRHAVCLGMSGSGKTGLCIGLLEEVALAGVPILAIDPKGDLANLALAFRDHTPGDFEPWVDPAEAARAGTDPAGLAAKLSEKWRAGMAATGVDVARAHAFSDRVRVRIFTPGSTAGEPVDVLGTFLRPPAGVRPEEEAWSDLVNGAVSGLLGLVGVEADPVRDPRHLVMARILSDAWAAGDAVDLETVVLRLVDPPFAKVGVFPVDAFLPRKERMDLAMSLNAVVSSPSFAAWSQGEPLDIDALLAPGVGAIQVMYLAHLDDARRTFFLSILLNQVVAWTRRQPGTSALRALVYFDEVYGFLPPYPKNPPTKRPVLTLLKQARAVGVGVMVVSQNPVDLDYAALANAGTWLLGRLNTAQDRERALDGVGSAGGAMDRATVERMVESLPTRTFLVREVAEPAPYLLTTRSTISWLRGPLTLRELEKLSAQPGAAPVAKATAAPADLAGYTGAPPPAPQGFAYLYLDPDLVFSARLGPTFSASARPRRADGATVWEPALYAHLALRFDAGTETLEDREEHRLWFPLGSGTGGANLGDPTEPPFDPGDFLTTAPAGRFAPLPGFVDEPRELTALSKRIVADILAAEIAVTHELPALKLKGRAGETVEAFRARADAAVQDRVDAASAKLHEKVAKEVEKLEEKRDKLAREKGTQESNARAKVASEVASVGESVFGWFFGGRSASTAASKAIRNRAASSAARDRVEKVDADLELVEEKLAEIESTTATELEAIEERERAALEGIRELQVRLDKEDVRVERFGIVWVPVTRAV